MILKVNRNKNYSVISNIHLRDKNLSLKAKGLLSLMLSLPDDWNYTILGLVAICKENETAITSALKELKVNGYLRIDKIKPNKESKGFEYIYNIFEIPQGVENLALENLGVESLGVENLALENQGLYKINNIQNTNIQNNNKQNKDKYILYGEYKRIKLTLNQYNKLIADFGEELINKQIKLLDEYVESNNNKNKYTNYNLVLRRSIREKWFSEKKSHNESKIKSNEYSNSFTKNGISMEEL